MGTMPWTPPGREPSGMRQKTRLACRKCELLQLDELVGCMRVGQEPAWEEGRRSGGDPDPGSSSLADRPRGYSRAQPATSAAK